MNLNIKLQKTKENFVPCQTKDCIGGFHPVAPVRVSCRRCGVKQLVKPNIGQEKKYDMELLYNNLYAVASRLTDQYTGLLYNKPVSIDSVEYAMNEVNQILKYINPHKKVPDMYAEEEEEDIDDMFDKLV